MMKFIVIIVASIVLSIVAGIYGIFHDIVTYNISSEYYTHFKFIEFGLTDAYGQPHINILQLLAITGWVASWWMGLIAGVVFALFALGYATTRIMVTSIMRATAIMIIVSVAFALLGYLAGLISNKFQIINPADFCNLSGTVKYVDYFNIVAFIHNFSYIGGIAGIILGCADIIRRKHTHKKG